MTDERQGRSTDERLVQALRELADVQLELESERIRRRQTESLFEEVVSAMSDALLLVDPRGVIQRCNEAAARLFARASDEIEGARLADIVGGDFPASPWQLFERSPSGQLHAIETTVLARGAGTIPVSLSCAVIKDLQGKVIGAIYAARDLSRTHQLLHDLEEAEARWRLLAEVSDLLNEEVDPREALPHACKRVASAADCGVAIVLVEDGFVSDVIVETGEAPAAQLDDLRGRPMAGGTALATVSRQGRPVLAYALAASFPLLSPGAETPWRSAALLPLMAKGTSLGALALLSTHEGGVTEAAVRLGEQVATRIALAIVNARLRDSLAELEAAREAARLREEMIAGVSHDMKTPLAVMVNLVSSLLDYPQDLPVEERRDIYSAMGRQTHRLRRLVQQFLDYSRLEAKQPLIVRVRPTDVLAVIHQLIASYPSAPQIVLEVPDRLPPVAADADRLDQVLANLVSNAVKFSAPETPVTITARDAGDSVEVSVIDRGPGIGPKDLATLFEKFHRGAGSRGVEGTGLGLYISKALLDAQGGRLTVSSRVGHGSRFTVVLPIAGKEGIEA